MALLEINDLYHSFGGLMALKDVNLVIEENEIRGIIGSNGAGKTTLFNMITRIYKPDRGRIDYMGKNLLAMKPHQLIEEGISRTFQNVELYYRMTVLENILVGLHTRIDSSFLSAAFRVPKSRREEKLAHERAIEALHFVGMDAFRDRIAFDLSFGQRRLVELARALVSKPTLLLLDEPAAGLSPQNVSALVNIIKKLRDELKITIILVEHVIKLVMGISDLVTVLNYGEVIAEGSAEEVKGDHRVHEAYLGSGGRIAAP